MRAVHAVRYVMPFREGSSVPALVEADDLGLYLVKLRGAGQGPRALVAELITAGLARAAGLRIPDVALVDLSRALARSEPDPELSTPLERSAGINFGIDYLPGSLTFDPLVGPAPDAITASRIVLFDALVTNVDRTPRNPNLLTWHRQVWLIDHGASLYFHHGWTAANPLQRSEDAFTEVRQHVLLRWASALDEAAVHLRATLTDDVIARVVADIPDDWLGTEAGFATDDAHRAAYGAWLRARVAAMPIYLEEARRAHALYV